MDFIKASNLRLSSVTSSPLLTRTTFSASPPPPTKFAFRFWPSPFSYITIKPLTLRARKRSSDSEPILKPTIVQEEEEEEEDLLDDFEYEASLDGDDYEVDDGDDDEEEEEEDYEDGDGELYAGDGGAGGGISLAGTWWDKKALAIAKEVIASFDGDLQIYAFKTLINSTIQVRIEKLSNKSSNKEAWDTTSHVAICQCLKCIILDSDMVWLPQHGRHFSTTYRAKLDEAELAKFVPENLSLEVSSPGVERIVRIPNDLDRFKDRPMYVKYAIVDDSSNPSGEGDGVFKLESFDMETKCCTWGVADVRVNRGKGRPLNKKQREWRLSTPFDSLRLVRLHSDC